MAMMKAARLHQVGEAMRVEHIPDTRAGPERRADARAPAASCPTWATSSPTGRSTWPVLRRLPRLPRRRTTGSHRGLLDHCRRRPGQAEAGTLDLSVFEHVGTPLDRVAEAISGIAQRNGGFSNFVIHP
jgi:hypothetical protein